MPAPILSIYEGAAGLGAGPGIVAYSPSSLMLARNFRYMSPPISGNSPSTYAPSEMPTAAKVAIGVGVIALLGVFYVASK